MLKYILPLIFITHTAFAEFSDFYPEISTYGVAGELSYMELSDVAGSKAIMGLGVQGGYINNVTGIFSQVNAGMIHDGLWLDIQMGGLLGYKLDLIYPRLGVSMGYISYLSKDFSALDTVYYEREYTFLPNFKLQLIIADVIFSEFNVRDHSFGWDAKAGFYYAF